MGCRNILIKPSFCRRAAWRGPHEGICFCDCFAVDLRHTGAPNPNPFTTQMAEVVGIGSGRIDMMGGVGDYSGSMVLQVATERATTVRGKIEQGSDFPEGTVKFVSDTFGAFSISLGILRALSATPQALELSAVREHLKSLDAPSWCYYTFGSVAVFFRETGWLCSSSETIVLSVSSTVPFAQGVSSSASIEVATIRALIALSGQQITQLRVAHIAQNAENFVVGAPCGLMDQLASALGSPGKVLPIVCRPDQCEAPVPLPDAVVVVGWPSGVKHSVAASPYLTARTATFMGKKIVEGLLSRKLSHVSELRPSELATVMGKVPESITGAHFTQAYGAVDDGLSKVVPETVYSVRASVTFAVEECFRCGMALSLLKAFGSMPQGGSEYVDALTRIGELMVQTHRGYTAMGLGAEETDVMIDRLLALGPSKGIYGARVSGGGSGGTVAVLCERTALPLVEALGREVTFGEPFPGLIN